MNKTDKNSSLIKRASHQLGLALKRAFYMARGRSYDKRQKVLLRTTVGMDDPAPIAGILATGADVEATSYDSMHPGEHPLYVALVQKRYKAAEALAKARPEWLVETNDEGETLLHRLAAADNADAVKALAGCGADMEAKDKNGRTPAMLAIAKSALNAAAALIENGAKASLDDPAVETACRVATMEMHLEFLKAIGRLQEEARVQRQAEIREDIRSIQNGTQRDIKVKASRLRVPAEGMGKP